TEKQIAAGEDRDDTAEDEQAGSAYDSACDERSIAGKQNIWNDRNDGPRRKRNKGACGSAPRRSQCCRIQSEFLSRERLDSRVRIRENTVRQILRLAAWNSLGLIDHRQLLFFFSRLHFPILALHRILLLETI